VVRRQIEMMNIFMGVSSLVPAAIVYESVKLMVMAKSSNKPIDMPYIHLRYDTAPRSLQAVSTNDTI